MQEPWKMTRNQDLNIMHVSNATSFVKSVKAHVIPGDTLIFDFIFFLHPVRLTFQGRAAWQRLALGVLLHQSDLAELL